MNRLKADQKSKVGKRKLAAEHPNQSDIESGGKMIRTGNQLRQFVQWTQAHESVAVSFLTKANWNIEYAMTLYFDNPHLFTGPPTQPTFDRSKMERLFQLYTDQRDNVGEKRMGPHGIARLLQDLSYPPTDRRVLILAWMFKAQTQCEFSLEEWVQGLTSLGVDNVQALKQRIDSLNNEIESERSKFRELYVFAFNYGKAASCRSLDLDTAVCYWDVLFGPRTTLMSQWIQYLTAQENAATAKLEQEIGAQAKKIKNVWITRDTWNLFWDFIQLSKPDLSDYDEEGAWPVLIDQFVDYCRETLNYPKPAAPETDEPMEQQSYY